MRLDVLGHDLRANRRGVIGWIAGIGAFLVINVATYPAVRDQSEYDQLLEDMPDAMLAVFGIDRDLSLTSPAGYLISQVFGFLLPLLLVVLAVALGSRLLAGEEERGTLDLLLAHPVSRRRVALEKAATVALVLVLVGAASWLVMILTSPLVGLDIGVADVGVATLASTLFGLQMGALAFGVAAAVGRRATALATAAVVAVLAFVLESLAELAAFFENLRWLSPFHFANGNTPLLHGLRWVDLAVLVGLTVVAFAVGIWRFDRRDLRS